MEIIIELLCNFFGEFLLQVGVELLIELGLHRLETEPEKCKPVFAFCGYGLLGAAAGGLSLLVFPRHFVRSSPLPGISLIIMPLAAGLAMTAMGHLRRKRGEPVLRIDRFAYAAVFAFGMALVRLHYAQ